MIQGNLNKKGKSFRWAGDWKENEHYFNDEFVQDFCRIDSVVVVCKASHLSKEENKPVILRDADNNQIGIQRNAYWEIALLPNTDFIIDGDNIHDGIITEAKLDDALQDKVNDNVKTVPQDLNEAQVKQAQKNIYFRDDYNNVYLDPSSYKGNTFGSDCANNYFSALCTENVFGKSCYNNTFGVYCVKNNFGDEFYENQLGNDCHSNVFGKGCCNNRFGNYCNNNIFNDGFSNNILDNNVRYITITDKHVKNIHILGNVQGSDYQRLKITIPAEYRDPDRRLIITRETWNGPLVMYFADEVARKAYIINYNDNEAYKTIEKWVADENKSQLYMYIGGYGEQENYVPAYISNNNEIAAETTSINNTTGNIKIEQYRYKYTGDDKYWYIRRSEGILPDRGTKAYIVTYDDNTCADTVDAWLNDPNKSQIYVRVPDASTNTKLLLAYLNSFKELVADDTNLADNASVKTQYLFKWYTPAGDIKNVYWYTRTFKSLSAETGAVKSANIAIGGVATANIADSAVKTAKLAQDAVTESKIADAAVTAKKLAPGVISGDTSVVDLKKKLEAEIQTRDNADTVLTTNLNAEESARIAADKTIKGQISDEEKARKTTDTELENKINAIQGLSTTEIDNAIKQ